LSGRRLCRRGPELTFGDYALDHVDRVLGEAFHLGDETSVSGDCSAGGGQLALFLGEVALGYGQFYHGVFDGQLSLAHIPFGSLQLF
jgi:hypothetical protein